jgi:hypothetical protein
MAVRAFPSAGLADVGDYGRILGLHMVANMDCSLGRQEPSLRRSDSIEGLRSASLHRNRPRRGARIQNALCITLLSVDAANQSEHRS